MPGGGHGPAPRASRQGPPQHPRPRTAPPARPLPPPARPDLPGRPGPVPAPPGSGRPLPPPPRRPGGDPPSNPPPRSIPSRGDGRPARSRSTGTAARSGTGTTGTTRTTGQTRRAAVPRAHSRRSRTGVGWWQTPDPKKATGTATGLTPAPEATGPQGPLDLLRRRLGGSAHRRPLTPAERTARRRRRVKWGLLGGAAALVLLPLLFLGIGWLAFSVPTADDAVNNQVATISYADGADLTRLVPEQGNRTKVTVDQIPVHVREAVLSAEDRSFYSNPGFDFTGILRAVWNQMRGGVGGGSTITQQYVKNALVGDQVSLWRKYKELIVSLKVNQEKSKDEILTDYLNTIYFGRGAYGVQSASQAYFGKDVGQLTVSEGALLAGVIQSPSRWDPAIDPGKAVQRWDFVMDGMVGQGWLSPADRAAATFPATQQRKAAPGSGSFSDSRGHVVNAVKAELDSLGITDQEMAQDGLRITTTIDPEQQRRAVDAAQKTLDGQPGNLRSAVVAIDPKTGGVSAYYGGDNGVGLDYARVSKQPGSTFKPFVVLAALNHDPPIGLGTVFDGSEETGLRNAEGADCPRCDIKQAMTLSNNVIFTKLAAEVGPENVAAAARAAGITSPLDSPDARLALGNKEVTPLELASAYATIADGGVWHAPHFISKVVTADDRVLYEAPGSQGERRFSEQVARNTVEAMLGVAPTDGLGIGRPVAGKTGTVQSRFEGQNNDAWFSGFTPDLATAVWIGTDMNSPIRTASGTPVEGKTLPGEMWQTFMKQAVQNEPQQDGFGTYKPIGEPASDLPPNATPSPTPTPSAPPSAPSEVPPPPPAASAVPTTEPHPGSSSLPDRDEPLSGEETPTTAPGSPPTAQRQDCTLTPCG
ncbi:penicillin-binding protein [Pseudonocardia sp. RS11V-5]|uniref:transglycosylase domain-containing protein n=1 Tax=Pseudonocardia terrae TaxID=2905831 RepID=UPI001E2E73F5|nr:transglycosylase domain-containing protein [Pseudonocardia terrae]MCE3554768.1 penicillin-binding protein [Pseudonocardia terrae]